MVFWRFVGIAVSIIIIIASIVIGLFFFGALVLAVVGIIALFLVLWLLFYARRKWRSIAAKVQEKIYHKKRAKKKGKRLWEQYEEIVVKDVKEEKYEKTK